MKTLNSNGNAKNLTEDAQKRLNEIQNNKKAVIRAWDKENHFNILIDLVKNLKIPCIVTTKYKLIDNGYPDIIHNLTVTGVEISEGRLGEWDNLTVINSGPMPKQQKNQLISNNIFSEAWEKADYDLIAYIPNDKLDIFNQIISKL